MMLDSTSSSTPNANTSGIIAELLDNLELGSSTPDGNGQSGSLTALYILAGICLPLGVLSISVYCCCEEQVNQWFAEPLSSVDAKTVYLCKDDGSEGLGPTNTFILRKIMASQQQKFKQTRKTTSDSLSKARVMEPNLIFSTSCKGLTGRSVNTIETKPSTNTVLAADASTLRQKKKKKKKRKKTKTKK